MDIYLHLPSGSEPPEQFLDEPFKAIIIIEQKVTGEWRNQISNWLVDADCKYMMAWGQDCSLWDEAVDWACIDQQIDINDETNFVITTWHENESLMDVFEFAQLAVHPVLQLTKLAVIYIGERDQQLRFENIHQAITSR